MQIFSLAVGEDFFKDGDFSFAVVHLAENDIVEVPE